MPSSYELSKAILELGKAGEAAYPDILKLAEANPEAAAGVKGEAAAHLQRAQFQANPEMYGNVTPTPDASPSEPGQILNEKGEKKIYGVNAAAPVAAASAVKNPLEYIKEGVKAYQENVTQPFAAELKSKLTPDINVQGQTYRTSSPVSNAAIDAASDPVNYVPGPVGTALQGAEAIGYATGGQAAPPSFDSMVDDSQAAGQPAAPQPQAPQQAPNFDDLVDDNAKYGTPGQSALAGLEGAARGVVSAPVVAAAERAVHGLGFKNFSGQAIRGREEANPIISGGSELAGLVGSSLLGVGEAAALEGAGRLATKAAGLSQSATTAAKIGSSVVKGAVEMGIYQGQDEAAKAILQDPNQSAESALAHVGLAAALGGGTGALFTGAVGPLWKATVGDRTENFLSGLSSRLGGRELEPGAIPKSVELSEKSGVAIPSEYAAKIDGAPGADVLHSTLSQTDTSYAGKKYQKGLEELNNNLGNGLQEALGHEPDYAASLGTADKYATGQQVGSDLVKDLKETVYPISKQYDSINEKLKSAVLTHEMIMDAGDQIAQKALEAGLHKAADDGQMKLVFKVLEALPRQETAEDLKKFITNLRNAHPFGSDTYQVAKEISSVLKDAQERAISDGILAKGGDSITAQAQVAAYNKLKRRYSQLMETFDGLNEHLHVGRYSGPQSFLDNLQEMVDTKPEDVLNRLAGKTKADQLLALGKISPEALGKVRQYHVDNILRASLDKEGNIQPSKFTKEFSKLSPQLQEVIASPEAQQKISAINDISSRLIDKTHNTSNTARTIDKLTHSAVSPLTMALGMFGHGYAAVMGHLGLIGYKESRDALKLTMLKFLGSNKPIKAEGFKAMASLINSSLKGQEMIEKGAEAAVTGAKILPFAKAISSSEIEKLDKLVAQNQQDPNDLQNKMLNSNLGHYMEEHNAALGQAVSQQIAYLGLIKPQPKQLSPLEKPVQPGAAAKARYERALKLAINPTRLYQHLQNGTLQAGDIQDMQAMYPATLNKMRSSVMQNALKSVSEGKQIPFKVKTGMSLMMGQALDPSLTPMGIQAAQPPPKPQQQPQGSPNKPKRGTATLGKTNKSYMTASQAAEADRGKRD